MNYGNSELKRNDLDKWKLRDANLSCWITTMSKLDCSFYKSCHLLIKVFKYPIYQPTHFVKWFLQFQLTFDGVINVVLFLLNLDSATMWHDVCKSSRNVVCHMSQRLSRNNRYVTSYCDTHDDHVFFATARVNCDLISEIMGAGSCPGWSSWGLARSAGKKLPKGGLIFQPKKKKKGGLVWYTNFHH